MNIDSVAFLRMPKIGNWNPLELEIDINDILKKREDLVTRHGQEPEFVIIKLALPQNAQILGLNVRWEFF